MDFFEAQEFFKKMYPDKLIRYDFDESCHRLSELVFTEGLPNLVHHLECRQVKVTVDGQDPFYAPIKPHRIGCSWAEIKNMLLSKEDVFIDKEELNALADLQDQLNVQIPDNAREEDKMVASAEKVAIQRDYDNIIIQIVELSGLSKEKIEEKIKVHRENNK